MTPSDIPTPRRSLQAQGHSLREISRLLALSRNTVRRILRQPAGSGAETPPCDEVMLGKLKAAFTRARGNGVRVRELLADDGLEVSYSTLTRWVREADLRGPLRRAGTYDFVPGQEMQHDTSPHRVRFVPADKPVTVQCAGLVLAYSRRLFIRASPASRPRRSCSRRFISCMASARSASSTTPASCSPPAPGPRPLSRRRWRPSPAL